MVVEDHEMNIRLEMFFVQFDSLVDSMSPLLLFLFFFFCHILQQWYFRYLRITGQNTKQNKPIRIPRILVSMSRMKQNWWNYKIQFLWLIHTVSGKAATWTIMEGVPEQYCTFFSFSDAPFLLFHSFLLMLVLHLTDKKLNSCDGQRTVLPYNHSHTECQ